MIQDLFYQIGYIKKPHGLRGEVTVVLLPESPPSNGLTNVFIALGGDFVPFRVERLSVRPDQLFVKWEDVNSVEDAARLKGCGIFLPKDTRPKPAKGEFYNDEITGFEVRMNQSVIGYVKAVTGHGEYRFVVLDNAQETLIPVNGPFIQSIQRARRRLIVSLPDGFLKLF
jgi:16S rRNA processing protein RimM